MAELFEKLGIDWKLLIANTATFFIVLWVLRKFAFKPLMAVMDKRQKTIGEGLDAAKRSQEELKAIQDEKQRVMEQAKTEALQMLQATQSDAAKLRQQLIDQAQADAAALTAKTQAELNRQKQQMLADAKGELADLVVAATEKVVGEQLDAKLNKKLADQAIAEVTK